MVVSGYSVHEENRLGAVNLRIKLFYSGNSASTKAACEALEKACQQLTYGYRLEMIDINRWREFAEAEDLQSLPSILVIKGDRHTRLRGPFDDADKLRKALEIAVTRLSFTIHKAS